MEKVFEIKYKGFLKKDVCHGKLQCQIGGELTNRELTWLKQCIFDVISLTIYLHCEII